MNLIFLNSFEKRNEEERSSEAQVMITELAGRWRVIWSEPGNSSEPREEIWFDGPEWKGMLEAFRMNVKGKLGGGFIPLIEGYTPLKEEKRSFVSRKVQLLHFYSENNCNADAFERLKVWRREQAQKEGKTAYFLASNRMLQMLAAFLPMNVEELKQIPGIGGNRLQAYGEAILSITKDYTRETAFPLDWVASRISPEQFGEWQDHEALERERQQAERMDTKKRLLEEIAQGARLAELGKAAKLSRRDTLIAVEELDKEGYDVSRLIEQELSTVDESAQGLAQRLFKELGDRYLKPVAARMLPDAKPGDKEVEKVYEWLRLYRMKLRHQTNQPSMG